MMSRALLLGAVFAAPLVAQDDPARLPDVPAPLRADLVGERPRPFLQLGDPFLGTGPLGEPLVLATGATWQPSFFVFGTLRSALSTFDDGTDTRSEWASRLDLFGNLQLSGTERVLVGLRPLDEDGRFTRYVFEPSDAPGGDGWQDEFNTEVTTLFFEGEIGELFPRLDPTDGGAFDVGFSIGRQPLSLQDGLLLDDRMDALGVTRNTLLPAGSSNLRLTGLFAWNEINRGNNAEDGDALLFGLSSEADLPYSTVSLDAIYVADTSGADTDAVYFGAGAVQRVGHLNTSLRAMTSQPLHDESPEAGRGGLLFAEVSRDVGQSDDLAYLNAFWAIDEFSSAARGPESGGPLGRAGVLFAAVGLGSYGAPLGNDATDSFGGALGWQTFLGDPNHRQQLILELGGRTDTDGSDRAAAAFGARYQIAFGRHGLWVLDGFVADSEAVGGRSGLRLELQFKF